MEKYSEDNNLNTEVNIFEKIRNVIFQLCFGVVAAMILLILIIPLVIYVLICVILNIEPRVKIINLKKNKNERK